MEIYRKLIDRNDDVVAEAMQQQVREPGARHEGGIVHSHVGIPSPSHVGTGAYMASMAASLVTKESKYYHSLELLAALERAADYLLRKQHADGTISPGWTNFHSPPDTGFLVTGLVQIVQVLERSGWEAAQPVVEKLREFLKRSIPAFLTGGCHTPNHRWVMTAALGALHQLYADPALLERAEQWLAEGMDCTEDGEWTERSNGIYNTVSNIMLIYTARYLGRPELLEPVRRNLEMMAYMIHYDEEVVTDYSGRQDLGQRYDLSEYFLSYRWMAALDGNPRFASMYDLAAERLARLGPINNHALLGYLAFPCEVEGVERSALPEHYMKLFNRQYPHADHLARMQEAGHHMQVQHTSLHTAFGAPVVRWRSGISSATLMAHSKTMFALRHGEARVLGIGISSLFMPGPVEMQRLEEAEDGFHMGAVMHKGYNGPIDVQQLPASAREPISPWYLLPHQYRELTHVQRHELAVTAKLVEEREWVLAMRSDDHEDVVYQVALWLGEGELEGGQFEDAGNGRLYWLGGTVRYTAGGQTIELSGGRKEHGQPDMSSLAVSAGRTLLVNLVTPFDAELRIRLK